jgi:hypothetical protein
MRRLILQLREVNKSTTEATLQALFQFYFIGALAHTLFLKPHA